MKQNTGLPLMLRWGRYFLSHYFPAEFSEMHKEWAVAMEEYKEVAIAAPRGHGKSAICHLLGGMYFALEVRPEHGILIIDDLETEECVASELQRRKLWQYCQGTLFPFLAPQQTHDQKKQDCLILSVSATADVAELWLDRIKDELMHNELILKEYPFLLEKKSRRAESDRPGWDKQGSREIKLPNGVRIKARGVYAARRGHRVSRIFMIGNYLAPNALLKKIVENRVDFGGDDNVDLSSFFRKVYRAFDAAGEPTCPAMWTKEDLEAQRKKIGEVAFAAEYMNAPETSDVHKFQRRWITYWNGQELDISPASEFMNRCELFIAYDAAAGTTKHHDFRAWLLCGRVRDPKNAFEKQLFVFEWGMNRLHPKACAAEIVYILEKYLYRPFFIERSEEGTAQLWLKQEIYDQMKKLSPPRTPRFITMQMPGDKFARWEHACAFFGGTPICIPTHNSHVIVEQCVGFPDVDYDDVVDALGVAARYCAIIKAKPAARRHNRYLLAEDEYEPQPIFINSPNYKSYWENN